MRRRRGSMDQILSFIKKVTSFIQKHLVGLFCKSCCYIQTEEILEDQNGHYTLQVSTPEMLGPSSDSASDSDIEADSSFRLHQNVDTICIDIVKGNKQEQESVSCVLNVEIFEERQIDGSVPEISVYLEDQNEQYTLPVSTPEENNKKHDSVSRVFSVETLEKGKIVASVPERWIRHYCSTQRILVVGDGNFSFSASLARAFGSATNMVATSLDSRVKSTVAQRLTWQNLKGLGCTIIHGVDCCTMYHHARLKSKLFDRIVYNFPHAGVFSESSTWVIEAHKSVVSGFLRNAVKMLRENGEVHITHKTAHPFNKWEIKKLADEAGLRFFRQVPFSLSDYPGYRNKYGAGKRSDESFPVGASSTYKFKKK